MKSQEFDQVAYSAYRSQALDLYSFKTCTYPGGSSYGISEEKKCRKAPEGAKEEKVKAKAGGSGGLAAAETLGSDGLAALPDGAKVDLADGSVYQKKDGKFYNVGSDGELSSLDFKPGELASQAKYTAESNPRKADSASAKDDSGSSTDIPPKADYKDQSKMEKAADDWRKKNGLEDETSDHDRVHMMVHAFDQKGSKEIGALTGEKGVSSTEEVLVNLASMSAQGHSKGANYNRAELIREAKDMKEFLNDELSSSQKKNFDKAATAAVDEFLKMSKEDGFDDFMFTLEANSIDG